MMCPCAGGRVSTVRPASGALNMGVVVAVVVVVVIDVIWPFGDAVFRRGMYAPSR